MSFFTVGGDGSNRPTFFELIAADRLMPSLKAAVIYSLSVRNLILVKHPSSLDLEHICSASEGFKFLNLLG